MIAVTGGFVTTVFGLRVSSRSAAPAVLLSLLALVAWLVAARRSGEVTGDLHARMHWLAMRSRLDRRRVAALAAAIAALFHSFSATGADASGYLSYTAMLLDGALLRQSRWRRSRHGRIVRRRWHRLAGAQRRSRGCRCQPTRLACRCCWRRFTQSAVLSPHPSSCRWPWPWRSGRQERSRIVSPARRQRSSRRCGWRPVPSHRLNRCR